MSSSYLSDDTHYDNLAAYPPPPPPTHYSFHDPHSLSIFDSPAAANPSPPIYASGGELPFDSPYFSSETDASGSILPHAAEMGRDGGYALREWRRQNAIRLEEKEKREKELLDQIIHEADEYKIQFQKKWELNCQSQRAANREKEKVFIVGLQKFHAEADKDYWNSIAELIPKEAPVVKGYLKTDQEVLKKKREDQDKGGQENDKVKKPTVCIIQGPKPGKPTDLTRMRQLLLKMKHDSPPHLNLSLSTEAKTYTSAASTEPSARK